MTCAPLRLVGCAAELRGSTCCTVRRRRAVQPGHRQQLFMARQQLVITATTTGRPSLSRALPLGQCSPPSANALLSPRPMLSSSASAPLTSARHGAPSRRGGPGRHPAVQGPHGGFHGRAARPPRGWRARGGGGARRPGAGGGGPAPLSHREKTPNAAPPHRPHALAIAEGLSAASFDTNAAAAL